MEEKSYKNVSPSEAKVWLECGWRHKLIYIDKLGTYEDTIYTDFGTHVHGAIEGYLKTRTLNIDNSIEEFKQLWNERGYPDNPTWPKWKSAVPDLNYWVSSLKRTLEQAPDFIETTFPNWKLVAAEERLRVQVKDDVYFKGFIDCVLSVPNEDGIDTIHILDWKTSGSGGWSKQKIKDLGVNLQPQLYRKFWAQRENVDISTVKSGFILLKRLEVTEKKTQKFFEHIEVPYSEEKTLEAVNVINRMTKSLLDKRHIKNREACKFCVFHQTEHCKI